MKYTLVMFFYFTLVVNALSQSDLAELESAFIKYRSHIESKNYDKAFDCLHESFLKYVPKTALKKEFSKMNANPNYTYLLKNSHLLSTSKIIEKDAVKYSFIKYQTTLLVKFRDDIHIDTIQKIKDRFKSVNGDNYTFIESDNTIKVYKEKEMIALNDSVWRFIIYKDKIKDFMHLWVPQDVFNSLLLERK